ncbi:MAG: TetR family transcriptional regulator [Rhodobacterales bacterium]|nr:MAG: TetR family transcriptional regulator [Rhodobacterales bacterium]
MRDVQKIEKKRQRAPSRRALATRERILDASERVFAARGFEGATIRVIAAEAGVQVGLVHHHGHGKDALYRQVIARRADVLAGLRRDALEARKAAGAMTVPTVMECFVGPYLHLAENGGAQWLSYARLVAQVSADPRWRDISEQYFDPTAGVFLDEIAALYPGASRSVIAAGFVYSVSAMLALLTSRWRMEALGEGAEAPLAGHLEELVTFCSSGLAACLAMPG